MKGNIVRAKARPITIGGQELEFRFDMNTMCELEEIYLPEAKKAAAELPEGADKPNAMSMAFDDLAAGKIKAVRALLCAGLRHCLPEGTTPEDVGSMIDFTDVTVIQSMIIADSSEKLFEPTGEPTGE